jgi:glutamate/aspartate transport system permease protein
MDYRWHWGVLLQPVATGKPATYLGWLVSGLVNTVELTLLAFSLAFATGTVFGVMRTLPNRAAKAVSAAYVSIFRGVPLIVQFFIWFFVVPELLPAAIGDWLKSLSSHPQFLIASVASLGVYTGSRIRELGRSMPHSHSVSREHRHIGMCFCPSRFAPYGPADIGVPHHIQELGGGFHRRSA